jgi:hypothetical protein
MLFRNENCHSICSKRNAIEVYINYYSVTCCFKFAPETTFILRFLPEACVVLVSKAAEEVKITIFLSLWYKKNNN